MGPLALSELGEGFSLVRALEVGLLPGIYLERDVETARKVLRTYAATYLREEIQAEALTRNLEGFSRFFHVIASRSGDTVDFMKFGFQAMIDRMSARRYFDIMADTLILQPVDAFAKSAKRRLVQHPKYYIFDVGVLNGALANFTASEDRKGALFEHLFLQLALSEAKQRDVDIKVSTYRTEAGAEVDFIIERQGSFHAVEVKASRTVGAHDLRGLRSFGEYVGRKHHPLVVYLGERELQSHGVRILPLEKGLAALFD